MNISPTFVFLWGVLGRSLYGFIRNKKKIFIVFNIITDILPALFDNGVTLFFKQFLLLFNALGVFLIQLAVGFEGAPVWRFILIFKLKVYKKSSKSLHIWLLRRFFVYTLIKN